MKRPLLTALLSFVLVAGVSSAPVNRSDAMTSAKNFLLKRGISSSLHELSPSRSACDGIGVAYHIFNIGNDEGYVVVAGDDRARTILAYGNRGTLTPENMPEPCMAWLRQYAGEIASLSEENEISMPVVHSVQDDVVAPLLRSKWDQDAPYNFECPVDAATGKRCAAGCVATAVAQVMYYYRYPEKGVGSVTYTDGGQKTTRTIDFADYPPFAWADMTDTYDKESTEVQCQAVASLMKAIGYASKMRYGSTSTARPLDAAEALVSNFAYDKNIHHYERARMTDDEWVSLIISELTAGRPVVYTGYNSDGGHSFVCDGYDGNGYFHFNWGWSGLSDGYYSLSALNPPNQSTGGTASGYSLIQSVLCHIAPPGEGISVAQTDCLLTMDKLYFRGADGFHAAADTPVLHTTLYDAVLYFYSYNKGLYNFSGEVCAADITDGNIRPLLVERITDLARNEYTGLRFPITGIAGLTDGTFKVGFYYRTSDTDSWHVIKSSTTGAPSECYVTISGNDVTFTAVNPIVDVKLTSAPQFSTLYTDVTTTWTIYIENIGDTRFEGYTGVALIDESGAYKAFYQTPVLCPVGETVGVDVKNTLSDISSGIYKAVVYRTYSSNPSPATIIPLTEPVKVNVCSIVVMSSTGNYLLMENNASVLTLSIHNIGNESWQSSVDGIIIAADGSVTEGKVFSPVLTADAGKTITVQLETEGLNLRRGNYTLNLYADATHDILLTAIPLIVMTDISALDEINTDKETIVSARLYDSSGRLLLAECAGTSDITLATASLPNGIYILVSEGADGNMTSRKVIIRH